MLEWLSKLLLAGLIVQIPFELRYTFLGLSNLQWNFVALVLASGPLLLANRTRLLQGRLVQAAALFVTVQWLATVYAPEFHTNALKGAIRFTAGFLLLAIVRASNREQFMTRVWVISGVTAAAYALIAYGGIGFPGLFRTEEFYIGQIRRLSGSFEYPNTAAAYFAMSLPIVWWSSYRPVLRSVFVFLLWCAIVLTFSRGALLAVPVVTLIAAWKRAAPLLGIGAFAYVALLPLNPYLLERIYGPTERNPIAAEYKTAWNKLQQQPGKTEMVPLVIHNTGISTWRSQGWWRVSVAYRWWDINTETFIDVTPVVTPLPHNVPRGETVDVPAAFRTPDAPGHYLLVLELFSRNFDWFSRTRVIPVLIEADIQPAVARSVETIDLSAMYNRGRNPNLLTAAVPRSSLWGAAWKMFIAHPFGIGPDNYRLEYGKYLGAARWDTHLYSNNLYLELLTGSGILGLAAFLLILAVHKWRADAPSLAAGIFLVHGFVDVFLMTTPIYFAFWLLLGEVV